MTQQSDGSFPLPAGLSRPVDDGGARHLTGMRLPDLTLPSTRGGLVKLAQLELATPRAVFYLYPSTGVPGVPLPEGWDEIPGARGCTPQSCAFRDHAAEFHRLGATIFGISRQTTEVQAEAEQRLHLPFPLLSDAAGALTDALRLPTFAIGETIYLKRLTMIVRNGAIEHVFYPVFPPDRNADEVAAWLAAHAT